MAYRSPLLEFWGVDPSTSIPWQTFTLVSLPSTPVSLADWQKLRIVRVAELFGHPLKHHNASHTLPDKLLLAAFYAAWPWLKALTRKRREFCESLVLRWFEEEEDVTDWAASAVAGVKAAEPEGLPDVRGLIALADRAGVLNTLQETGSSASSDDGSETVVQARSDKGRPKEEAEEQHEQLPLYMLLQAVDPHDYGGQNVLKVGKGELVSLLGWAPSAPEWWKVKKVVGTSRTSGYVPKEYLRALPENNTIEPKIAQS